MSTAFWGYLLWGSTSVFSFTSQKGLDILGQVWAGVWPTAKILGMESLQGYVLVVGDE